MRTMTIALTAIGLLAGSASAIIVESESNNTLATADVVGPVVGAEAVLGSLSPNDVDFFRVELLAGTLFAAVLDFTPASADNDSTLGLFDSVGNLIAVDDDSGPDFLSLLFVEITTSGTYYLAISGFPDFDFNGGHSEEFSYKLVINAIPAPATLATLAGVLALGRRRRN